jgi:hypothetical protein
LPPNDGHLPAPKQKEEEDDDEEWPFHYLRDDDVDSPRDEDLFGPKYYD